MQKINARFYIIPSSLGVFVSGWALQYQVIIVGIVHQLSIGQVRGPVTFCVFGFSMKRPIIIFQVKSLWESGVIIHL